MVERTIKKDGHASMCVQFPRFVFGNSMSDDEINVFVDSEKMHSMVLNVLNKCLFNYLSKNMETACT